VFCAYSVSPFRQPGYLLFFNKDFLHAPLEIFVLTGVKMTGGHIVAISCFCCITQYLPATSIAAYFMKEGLLNREIFTKTNVIA
jgi:hypothetical protein